MIAKKSVRIIMSLLVLVGLSCLVFFWYASNSSEMPAGYTEGLAVVRTMVPIVRLCVEEGGGVQMPQEGTRVCSANTEMSDTWLPLNRNADKAYWKYDTIAHDASSLKFQFTAHTARGDGTDVITCSVEGCLRRGILMC